MLIGLFGVDIDGLGYFLWASEAKEVLMGQLEIAFDDLSLDGWGLLYFFGRWFYPRQHLVPNLRHLYPASKRKYSSFWASDRW